MALSHRIQIGEDELIRRRQRAQLAGGLLGVAIWLAGVSLYAVFMRAGPPLLLVGGLLLVPVFLTLAMAKWVETRYYRPCTRCGEPVTVIAVRPTHEAGAGHYKLSCPICGYEERAQRRPY